MTPTLRDNGYPSPLEAGTHASPTGEHLPEPIPFDPAQAGTPELPPRDLGDPFALDPVGMPPKLVQAARLIRPLSVAALMAIPTVGAAVVGLVAAVAPDRALVMAEASTRFLSGIPGDIVALIGFLAGGYGLAKTIERRRGTRAL